ncbi:SpnB-like Rossmann fold domain-containing protein, partial [Streptomyces sodiiphilus]|uniref:SpnB-like Rossmann fold domain-containing protein n=1 Tax=Streptomyces sodiiphilus TaxID=226217 RepID=UPI0031D23E9D
YGIHPALLDAALHTIALGPMLKAGEGRLPFSWTEVSLHATDAVDLRVRLAPEGNDTVALTVADSLGQPVATVGSLVLRKRPESLGASPGSGGDVLYGLDWVELEDTADRDTAPREEPATAQVREREHLAELAAREQVPATVTVPCTPETGDTTAETVRAVTHRALALVQDWLAEESFAGSRLVFVTRGAVAARPGEGVSDPAHAAVWGLVRAAQSENPGRFVLADLDDHEDSPAGLVAGLTSEEPQFAVREGRAHVARLAVAKPAEPAVEVPAWDTAGTVLVTGATGTIGGVIARHLVARGARHLL